MAKAERVLKETAKENEKIDNPEAKQRIEFLNHVVAECLKDIRTLEAGEEPEPKTIIVSEHYENGSQTKIYSHASINNMTNVADSVMGSLPKKRQLEYCMKLVSELLEFKNAK